MQFREEGTLSSRFYVCFSFMKAVLNLFITFEVTVIPTSLQAVNSVEPPLASIPVERPNTVGPQVCSLSE